MPAADIAAIFIALARFTGAVYPDRLEAVDDVLAACQQVRAVNPSVTLNDTLPDSSAILDTCGRR